MHVIATPVRVKRLFIPGGQNHTGKRNGKGTVLNKIVARILQSGDQNAKDLAIKVRRAGRSNGPLPELLFKRRTRDQGLTESLNPILDREDENVRTYKQIISGG